MAVFMEPGSSGIINFSAQPASLESYGEEFHVTLNGDPVPGTPDPFYSAQNLTITAPANPGEHRVAARISGEISRLDVIVRAKITKKVLLVPVQLFDQKGKPVKPH